MTELLAWANHRPLFTLNDAQRALGMKRASLREKLSRLARRGEINRIERGKYSVHDDPMIYATHIETPSYASLWSALRYYDLTTQQPTKVQVMTPTGRTDLPEVVFYQSSQLFGFGRRRYEDFEVFVADEERLLLDCLSRKEISVTDLSELLETIDPERAAAYAERFGRNAVKKRVGYLLERVRDVTIDDLRVSDRNYPLLDLAGPDDGDPDSRWRLRVNVDVV